jgi:hypothetical protein
VVAGLLKVLPTTVCTMKTLENETIVDLVKQSGWREIEVLFQHKLRGTSEDGVGDDEFRFPEIILRAIEDDVEGVAEILASGDSNPDVGDDQGGTALYYAVSLGHVEVVRTLVRAGGQPERVVTKDGESPLMCAKRLSRDKIVAALVEGADASS